MNIRKIIKEGISKSDELQSLSDKIFSMGVTLRVYIKGEILYITHIERNQGSRISGTEAMSMVVNFADNNQLNMSLWASPNYGVPLNELVKFYEKFDFVVIRDAGNGKIMDRTYNK